MSNQVSPPSHSHREKDEMTLKEILLKIQAFFWEVVRNWWIVALIAIPIITFMLYQALITPAIYPATLTFMVNDNEGGSMAGVGAILGQFGLGGGNTNQYNLDKILELSRSRRIVQMALFEQVIVNGKGDFLANHLIKEYQFHKKWAEDTTGLKNFLFRHDSIEVFSLVENKALKSLHAKVIGNENVEGVMSNSYGGETGIMSINTQTTNETLSIALAEFIYKKLRNFYIQKTVEQQRQTYILVKAKTDSLQTALNTAQYRLLRFEDSNRGLRLRQYEAEKLRLQQESQKLIAAFAESYKNLELADFTLKNKTPFVQVIDLPIAPIKPIRESKLIALVIGTFIGVFLGIVFVLGRKIIRDTMKE